MTQPRRPCESCSARREVSGPPLQRVFVLPQEEVLPPKFWGSCGAHREPIRTTDDHSLVSFRFYMISLLNCVSLPPFVCTARRMISFLSRISRSLSLFCLLSGGIAGEWSRCVRARPNARERRTSFLCGFQHNDWRRRDWGCLDGYPCGTWSTLRTQPENRGRAIGLWIYVKR